MYNQNQNLPSAFLTKADFSLAAYNAQIRSRVDQTVSFDIFLVGRHIDIPRNQKNEASRDGAFRYIAEGYRCGRNAYNAEHGITPRTVLRGVADIVGDSENAQKIKDERDSYTPSGRKSVGKSGKANRKLFEVAEDQEGYMGGNIQAVLADLEKKCLLPPKTLNLKKPPASGMKFSV